MTDTTFAEARPSDLTRHRMERLSPLLEETWRYWSSLRRGDSIPPRALLEPASMALVLGHAMILDRVREGLVRVRIGGRVMNDLMGMEVRGLPMRAFFETGQRHHACALVERVFATPATLELDLTCDTRTGPLHARMLVLPLRDRDGAVTKALTCLAADGAATAPPHRFRIRREHLAPLAPPADPARGMRPEGGEGAARPFLRVVT